MKRVEENEEWCLMCPAQCPGLSECWGEEFEELYTRYEKVRPATPTATPSHGLTKPYPYHP